MDAAHNFTLTNNNHAYNNSVSSHIVINSRAVLQSTIGGYRPRQAQAEPGL